LVLDDEFETLYVYSEKLSPYATAFRYHDVCLEPDYDDVEKAIEMARNILEFVTEKIDADVEKILII